MPSVYNRGTRAKPNYWVTWFDRNGERHAEKVGPDRVLAKQVAAKLEVAKADKLAKRFGIDTDAPPAIPTFSEAVAKFIERRSAVGKDGLPMRRSWKDDKAHSRSTWSRGWATGSSMRSPKTTCVS